jgi:hypothetical protein
MRRLIRHNPETYSASDIASVARSMNLLNLAGLLDMGGDIADQLVAAINEAVGEEEEEEETTLTDRKAWTMLADLAETVGEKKGWPKELISSLQKAFREEAKKAA